MKEIAVGKNEAGQRLDKLLHKLLSEAPEGIIYKQLRRKNITLNKKRASGSEKIKEGDVISLFFSDETYAKFIGTAQMDTDIREYQAAYEKLGRFSILYEDGNILIIDKPAGILTQKAKEGDLSLNEWLIGYLLAAGKLQAGDLTTFKPSVCNRLDRNTSGMVICGISLPGSQKMSALLKDRSLHKFYRLIVKGTLEKEGSLEGYLQKNEKNNTVRIAKEAEEGAAHIHTKYKTLYAGKNLSYAEVELITGKTHQIRAHLASIGHPILGDAKYGDTGLNEVYQKKYGITAQLLHAYRLEFPELSAPFAQLSGKVIVDDVPKLYAAVMMEEKNGNLEIKRS